MSIIPIAPSSAHLHGSAVLDPRQPSPAFTPREHEVLTGYAHGLRTREIADRLCLSRKTVETYVRSIQAKAGLGHLHQTIVYAVLWALSRPQEGAAHV
jgi:DNA-binding NarL/FixJ family response regulator